MNPLQGSNQVGVANIGGIPIFFYAVWGKVQIAQNIQTVIYTYDNNIAKFGKIFTIVGDLFKIAPMMIEAVKAAKASK